MTRSGEQQPTIEDLRGVVQEQREEMKAQAARIAALEWSLQATLQASTPSMDDIETQVTEGDELRVSRALLLKAATVTAAGIAGASLIGNNEPAFAEVAQAGRAGLGIAGAWIVSITYTTGPHRTRGLATFTTDGGFVGSVSAYERSPTRPTPTRGTTLHGTWVRTGERSFAVTAVRLHLDRRGTLLGVMTTQLAATIAAGHTTWDGTFTFDAAHPNGQIFKTGKGTVHGVRIGRHL